MGTNRWIPNNYVSDWTGGLGDKWVFAASNNATAENYPAGSKWLRVADSGVKSFLLMPRFVIGGGASFVIEVETRITGTITGYQAATLYNGEANYCGLYLNGNGSVDAWDLCLDNVWTTPTGLRSAGWWTSGTLLTYKITYTASTGVTALWVKKEGESYTANPQISRTDGVDGRQWAQPLTLWLQNYQIDGTVEYGDIRINRTSGNVVIAGAYDYYVWGNNGIGANAIWDYGWPDIDTDTAYNPLAPYAFWREGAGEGPVMTGGLMGNYHEDGLEGFAYARKGGPVSIISPEIAIPEECEPAAIKFFGTQAPGTLKVWVLGPTGDDTPLANVTASSGDNVNGFMPDGGPFVPLAVDISQIEVSAIRYKVEITNNSVGDFEVFSIGDYTTQVWPTVLHGYAVEVVSVSRARMIDGTPLGPFRMIDGTPLGAARMIDGTPL